MDTPGKTRRVTGPFRPVPALPKPVVGLWAPALVGTTAWLVALVVLLVTGADNTWTWTALAGGGLGCVGFGIITWQTTASRHGSRGAQRDL
ncbi:Protein of unknown function (DUF2530) [Prauserella aidingensis]|uniref:DUF2530 domain-containing protein n=1 Tax=Prauserella aidingensis TaxID=387890 RepID=UPI0027E37F13|nr:DUF2530 domain-containing protein [Prauserella aidingensis]MCP2252008.1 Protein of unknown function (DUF2530) [Prauserella aidingensis]